jgi:hypothetical protein
MTCFLDRKTSLVPTFQRNKGGALTLLDATKVASVAKPDTMAMQLSPIELLTGREAHHALIRRLEVDWVLAALIFFVFSPHFCVAIA